MCAEFRENQTETTGGVATDDTQHESPTG